MKRALSASDAIEARDTREAALPATLLAVGRDGVGAHAGVHARALPAVVGLDRGDLDKAGVHPGQVVVLHEVLAEQLVVGRYVVVGGASHLPFAEAVSGGPLGQVAEMVRQWGGVVVEADEHERPPGLRTNGQQAVVRLVESGDLIRIEDPPLVARYVRPLEQWRADAGAIERVGPAVVRAADGPLHPSGSRIEQPRATVAAGVVEGPQFAVEPADHDERTSGDIGHQELTRIAKLRRGAYGRPARGEDPLPLDREELVGGVGLGHDRLGECDGAPRPGVRLLPSEDALRRRSGALRLLIPLLRSEILFTR